MDLKATLNLPDAQFTIPMKADLATREPSIQAKWDEIDLYASLQEIRKDSPLFMFHDGPPYTNSPIHVGTALNKILKDFVVKSRSMMGFRTPLVHGFDNHGLPIEQAALANWVEEVKADPAKLASLELGEKPSDVAISNRLRQEVKEFRTRCRNHAQHYINVQTSQFQRLGIYGEWKQPYKTMDFRYEAEIIRIFKRLVEREQIYRGMRPVLWSPTIGSALADTEIVYQDKTSKAIHVAFALKDDPHHQFAHFANLHTIIWTTTAWTIPANLACAFHPEHAYAVVKAGDRHYLMIHELMDRVMGEIGVADYEQVAIITGKEIEPVTFQHPLFDRPSRAVLADYVTTEDGTGVVHTAPGHGRDDFYTGLRYNLGILCPVDGAGMMTSEAGEFEGLYYEKCGARVIERLREVGALLSEKDYKHSYPHADRDSKPVIFRATDQWFISVEANDLRQRMLDGIVDVKWLPETAQNRIESMMANRPDWCISRQRPWGVGIPVFYGVKSGKPLLDPKVMEHVAGIVEKEGSDAWFLRSAEELLPPGTKHPETGETEFRKETDCFDVWFDSGCTNLCVLEGNVNPAWPTGWPADLYLEGSDQHRGWFNTSLIIGTATRDAAPYKTVLTHGFVLDENREKMSKRKGNVTDPVVLSDTIGADILRYWAASVDYTEDVPIGEAILKQCGDQYRTIRNAFRFLLGNLAGFTPDPDLELLDLDRWVIHETQALAADCVDAYQNYDFSRALTSIHNFCAKEISAFYLDAIKDRMYCDGTDWPSRKSGQIACHFVLSTLVRLVAPILVHTADEVYERLPGEGKLASVHMELFPLPGQRVVEQHAGDELSQRFAAMLRIRADAFVAFEGYKATGAVKNSQDALAKIRTDAESAAILKSFGHDLAIYFKMSEVLVEVGEPGVTFEPSPYLECERSRLKRPDVVEVPSGNGAPVRLTERDRKVLAELGVLA